MNRKFRVYLLYQYHSINYFFINLQFLIFSENTRTLRFGPSYVTFEVYVQIVNCLLLVTAYIDADTVK